MDIEVDFEPEMKLSCKELRVFLHEFRLGRKSTEAARNIQYNGQ